MTESTPEIPSAKEIAKHVDRRRLRRRLILWLALLAAVVLALLYLRCGGRWGLGAGSSRPGSGTAAVVAIDAAGPHRCAIFVAAEGIQVDGVMQTRDGAVAACKGATGADVIVAGDARRGDWDQLEAALDAAGIPIYRREPHAAPAVDAGP